MVCLKSKKIVSEGIEYWVRLHGGLDVKIISYAEQKHMQPEIMKVVKN